LIIITFSENSRVKCVHICYEIITLSYMCCIFFNDQIIISHVINYIKSFWWST